MQNALQPGTLLNSTLTIKQVLGAGGYGITYLAYDQLLAQNYAVKECYPVEVAARKNTISTGLTARDGHEKDFEKVKASFLKEAQILASIEHPGIVKIHRVFTENNTWYIVMEYLSGRTLNDFLQQEGPVDYRWLFTKMKPILSALENVHNKGLIHRDISPDNIMLLDDGTCKLMDFGAAVLAEAGPLTTPLGKPGFSPIEQYNVENQLTPASDLYSLCATFYTMLTGIKPLSAIDRTEALLTKKLDPIIPIDAYQKDIPASVEAIVTKGLDLSQDKRYQDATELLRDIEKISSLPKPKPNSTAYWMSIISGLLITSIIVLVCVLFAPSSRPHPNPVDTVAISTTPTIPKAAEDLLPIILPQTVEQTAKASPTTAPTYVLDFYHVQRYAGLIAAGRYHTVCCMTDGSVVETKFLGNKRNNSSLWDGICAVSAGNEFTLGLRSDGRVVAAGNNDHGQCNVDNWNNIVAISAGSVHTIGLKANGTVIGVGYNGYGQRNVNHWEDIISISAGNSHTLGLTSNGRVVATGANDNGKCDVISWKSIIGISAGRHHSLGLRSDGTVIAIGDNQYGQCETELWSNIVSIAAGGEHSVGLMSDGTVIATGRNEDGQCNVGTWTDIVAVYAGRSHTIGLKADGSVLATGSNESRQCDAQYWDNLIMP